MANIIEQIQLRDNTLYDIIDRGARNLIAALPRSMQFKGSLGENGTIISLPAASEDNEGFVYKVITAGTYQGKAAKVGDTFISGFDSTGSVHEWVLIPSGDEPSGTVTNIATGEGLSGGPITTTGSIAVDFNVVAKKSDIPTAGDHLVLDETNKKIFINDIDVTDKFRYIIADGRSLLTVNNS